MTSSGRVDRDGRHREVSDRRVHVTRHRACVVQSRHRAMLRRPLPTGRCAHDRHLCRGRVPDPDGDRYQDFRRRRVVRDVVNERVRDRTA